MDFLAQLRDYKPRDAIEAEVQAACLRLIEAHGGAVFGRQIAGDVGHLTSAAWIVNRQGTKVLLVFGAKIGRWKLPGEHVESKGEVGEVAKQEARRALGGGEVETDGGIFALVRREIPEYWNTPTHWHFEVVWAFRAEEEVELPLGAKWFLWKDLVGLGDEDLTELARRPGER